MPIGTQWVPSVDMGSQSPAGFLGETVTFGGRELLLEDHTDMLYLSNGIRVLMKKKDHKKHKEE